MQEVDGSKDDELVAKINRVMSGLPADGDNAGASDEMGRSSLLGSILSFKACFTMGL
jgi:hypothetical protein